MKYPILFAAVASAFVLGACERPTPTVVTVPAAAPPPTVVTVPGPAGPPGAPGEKGEPGKPGDTVVIVPPPAR